jgi:hypothetical protein
VVDVPAYSERVLETLYVGVLNLRSDWAIDQIWPSGLAEEFEAGHEEIIPLQASLPEAYDEGHDLLKVFATREQINLRILQLPALDEAGQRAQVRGAIASESSLNPREGLLVRSSSIRRAEHL